MAQNRGQQVPNLGENLLDTLRMRIAGVKYMPSKVGMLAAVLLSVCALALTLLNPVAARADVPVLGVDRGSIFVSESVQISFDAGDLVNDKNWVGVYRAGDKPGKGQSSVDWRYVPERSGLLTWGPSARDGWTQETETVAPGDYDLYLLEKGGYKVLAGPIKLTITTTPAIPKPKIDGVSELNVLTFNIWNGGTKVPDGAKQVAEVIVQTDSDVTFLPERGEVPKQAGNLLGYHYYSTSNNTGVISRYPIISTDDVGDRWTKAIIDVNGTEVAVYGGHLEYRWYTTYLPRGYGGMVIGDWPAGWNTWNKLNAPVTDTDLILAANLQSGRPDSAATAIADIAKERQAGRLVVLGGDFNEPSAQDWTESTAWTQDHNGVVAKWQTTQALLDAGLVDAFREIYPDPVTNPGTTWPSDNPRFKPSELSWVPEADERDRIDYIFASPDERLLIEAASVVGPQSTIVRNERVEDDSSDVIVTPDVVWPSDHKAVLVNFSVCEDGCVRPEPVVPGVGLDSVSVQAGGSVTVSGWDFEAGSVLSVELHSDPVLLGTVTADDDGTFELAAVVPQDTVPGDHMVVVTGPGGVTVSVPLTVTAIPGGETPGGETPGGETPGGVDGGAKPSEKPGGEKPAVSTAGKSQLADSGAEGSLLLGLAAVGLLLTGIGAIFLYRRRANM